MEHKEIMDLMLVATSDGQVGAVSRDDFSKLGAAVSDVQLAWSDRSTVDKKYNNLLVAAPLLYQHVEIVNAALSGLIFNIDELPEHMKNEHIDGLMRVFDTLVTAGLTVQAAAREGVAAISDRMMDVAVSASNFSKH